MKKNIWWKILPFTFLPVIIPTVSFHIRNTQQATKNLQKSNFNLIRIDKQLSTSSDTSLVGLPTSVNASLHVFLEWADSWLKESTNILDWLKQLGFKIDSSIKEIALKQAPQVNLINQNQIQDVQIQDVVVELMIDKNAKNITLNLSNSFFQPVIVVPNAINLYKEDFLEQLKTIKPEEVNIFLENYGFQINPMITSNIYTNQLDANQGIKYEQETETVTIYFVQYQKSQVIIKQPISFNIKGIYFQLPLNKNPSAIIGILLGLVILGLIIWYIAIKTKIYLTKKKNGPKVIPAWKLDKDKQHLPTNYIQLEDSQVGDNDSQHDLAVNTDVQLDYLHDHQDKKDSKDEIDEND